MLGADDPWAEEDIMSGARFRRRVGRLAASVLAILSMVAPGLAGDNVSEAWAALARGGHVALIRHGNAPPGYGGDPPGFRFDDCKTQRNLDDVGREQARASVRHFASTACAWTGSCPRPCAAAWRRGS